MGIRVISKGDFSNTFRFFNKVLNREYLNFLESQAQRGVSALASATPKESGATAAAWDYEIIRNGHNIGIIWTNSNVTKTGDPIAIMLQYGHGTGTGGYVQGRDYINPAIQPIFDDISELINNSLREG